MNVLVLAVMFISPFGIHSEWGGKDKATNPKPAPVPTATASPAPAQATNKGWSEDQLIQLFGECATALDGVGPQDAIFNVCLCAVSDIATKVSPAQLEHMARTDSENTAALFTNALTACNK